MTKSVTSLTGFINKVSEWSSTLNEDEVLLYRGHSNYKYKLIPSIFRPENNKLLEQEDKIFKELISLLPNEFSNDKTTLEQLIRAQHYSLPTRLLDVTWNPLVALYFASKDTKIEKIQPQKDRKAGKPKEYISVAGKVIAFKVKKSMVKYYDSDTASCLANLVFLSKEDKDKIVEIISRDDELTIDEFNQKNEIDRLLHFIRSEKPYFRPIIECQDLKSYLIIKPKMNNNRILAQSGAFILLGLGDKNQEFDNTLLGISELSTNINFNSKKKIRESLDHLNINDSTMFPEISKTAEYISKKFNAK